MLSRIRYFFEDIGYWFSDRLRLGRRRRKRDELPAGGGAEAKPGATPGPPQPEPPAAQPEPPATAQPAPTAPDAAPASEAPKPKRRLFRRRGKGAATPPAPEDAAASAASAPAVPGPATDPSAAETAQLPSAAAPSKRSRFGRPSLPRPSLPRPRMPGRPRLRRPGRRWLIAGGIVLLLAAAVAGVYLATDFDFGGDDEAAAPAPKIVIEEGEEASPPKDAPDLGFPAFATKNTTRVSGANPVADAAGVALATAPATGGVEGPPAVSIVDEEDWPAAIAAASLVADPIGAPILLSQADEVPELTLTALTELAPKGSPETGDSQLFRFGGALAPEGLRATDVDGSNPAELAAAAAKERERLTGEKPEHVVLASSDRPEFAMPAAAWAARSGDPVLFVQGDTVPAPTLDALGELGKVPTYVLGPEP